MIDVAGMTDELLNKEADAKTTLLKASQLHGKLWAKKITTLRKEDGAWVSNQSAIASYISEFYQRFHKASETVVHNDLLENIPRVLEEDNVAVLESVLSRDEIKQAVWDLDPASLPGPDGFPGSFFHKCWPIVVDNFCKAVKIFFDAGQLPKGINDCFISLIPKVEGAASLDRICPICMENFFCKVFVLANGGPVGFFEVGRGLRQDSWLGNKSIAELADLQLGLSYSLQARVSDFIRQGSLLSVMDLSNAKRLGFSGVSHRHHENFEIYWLPSQLGWAKLNTNGCSIGNPGNSGAGGVLRNEKAEVVGHFRNFLGTRTNLEAEFLAIMIGLEVAQQLGIPRLWTECDSTAVVILF
ncbi:uncharacterized protein LOC122067640 [Macadamia integrifolia]|uniref:uncharacterized protein LOC122067640 n=1 Tax=Macadamia integrifolia TaxID=60698 RepID=UPI001C4E9F18|nr:uncharacterized protein LOC122067640 [Macadamia integrifolia]